MEKIGVIISCPPYGLEDAFAGARLSLSMLANGAESPVFLMEGGVLNARTGQDSSALGLPSNLDALEDLFSISGEIFCVKEHLDEWGIGESELLEGVQVRPLEEVARMVDSCGGIVTF